MSEWVPQQELTHPVPRKVFIRQWWKLYMMFVLTPIVVAYCIFNPLRETIRRAALDEFGVSTTTTIDSFQRSRKSLFGNRVIIGACYTFNHAPYEHPQMYDTQTTTLACDRIPNTAEADNVFHVGQAIKVIYVKQNPLISEIVGMHHAIPGERFIFTLPLASFVVVALYFMYRAQIPVKKLYKYGRPASACIFATKDISILGIKLFTMLSYKFIDLSGNEIAGKAMWPYRNKTILSSNPTVLFDTQNSRNNILYNGDYFLVKIVS